LSEKKERKWTKKKTKRKVYTKENIVDFLNKGKRRLLVLCSNFLQENNVNCFIIFDLKIAG
jgi:hypothetical protein